MRLRGENEVREFFTNRGIRKEIHVFSESPHNSELAAKHLGVAVGQIAKTILLLVDEAPMVVVISGDRRGDWKKGKALRNGRRGRLGGPGGGGGRPGGA